MTYRITYDPAKNARNIIERGLPFDRVEAFDFSTAFVFQDTRRDYGEARFVATGYLDDRLHVLCFTEVSDGIRVISLRKANTREERRHAQAQAAHRQER
ncbi:MAG: BrnT family toxin [Proteobacteria bacterium]|nr:BrnT family toxin [Pseudomonadota bacterium]